MRASISEGGTLDAEYYRLDSKGHRVYNGYHEWGTFLGINHLRLAARWKHFKARPGRYVAVLRATDESNNTSKPVTKASLSSASCRAYAAFGEASGVRGGCGLPAFRSVCSAAFSVSSPIVIWNIASSASEASGRSASSASSTLRQSSSGRPALSKGSQICSVKRST